MKKNRVYQLMLAITAVVAIFFAVITYLGLYRVSNEVAGEGDLVPRYIGGFYASSENPMKKIMDVYSTGDRAYISEVELGCIRVFNMDGTLINTFGKTIKDKSATKAGEFRFPYGVTGDSQDNIYVADMDDGKISIFDKDGKFKSFFEPKEDYQFKGPGAIRIFEDKLYIPEVNSGNISVYDLKGERLLFIENPDKENEANLLKPNALVVNKDGHIFVSDTGHSRVVEFNDEGDYLRTIDGSTPAKTDSIFVSPRGLCLDDDNNLYVVDKVTNEVIIFDKDGKKRASFGSIGIDVGQFYYPNGLFRLKDGTLFVTDTVNQRVQMFK